MGPGTPFPVPVRLPRPPGGGGAPGRSRAQWVSFPSEPVRASRSGPAPPALTPLCRRPTRRPLSGSAWLQSSPNTSPGLPQGLDPLGFRAVTLPPRRRFHPVPVPIAVFGVMGILNRHWGAVNGSEGNPHESMAFPHGRGSCAQNDPQISPLRPVGRKLSGPPGDRLGPWFIRGFSLAE